MFSVSPPSLIVARVAPKHPVALFRFSSLESQLCVQNVDDQISISTNSSPLVLIIFLLSSCPFSTSACPTQHPSGSSILSDFPFQSSSTYIPIQHIPTTIHCHFAIGQTDRAGQLKTDIFHGMSARKMKKTRVVSSGAKQECDTLTTAKRHQNDDCGNSTRRHPANDTAFEVVCRAKRRSEDLLQTNWPAR